MRSGLSPAGSAIEVVLHEMGTAEQLDALLHGLLHAGFVNAAAVPPQLASLPLEPDEFVLCLPRAHPRAHQAEVDLRTLADERFVMFSREVSPANYDNSSRSSAGWGSTPHRARRAPVAVADHRRHGGARPGHLHRPERDRALPGGRCPLRSLQRPPGPLAGAAGVESDEPEPRARQLSPECRRQPPQGPPPG